MWGSLKKMFILLNILVSKIKVRTLFCARWFIAYFDFSILTK